MSAQTASVSIPSIFRTLSTAPRTREHHQAARQLAGLDPKIFLSNLQAAAVNRSPHAIAAVKSDMVELEDIFHKLSRSGYDVSAAQRDFEMLSHFVSQLASTQKQRSHTPLPPSTSQPHHPSKPLPATPAVPVQKYHHDGGHHRTSSLPTSVPSSYEQPRSRTGSFSIVDSTQSSTRYHPHAVHAQVSNNNGNSFQTQGGKGFASGGPSSSSSSRSSSSHSSAQSSSSRVVAPAPRHLIKPRRHSEPVSLSSASSKKVHFATHATVYTFAQEAPALVPPPRPSCIPRVGGSESPRSTSHDGRSRH